MYVGEVLNGYEITTPPTNAGGGMSQWSFAEKEGREYFFKMFLAPKFPLDEGPGSATAKARKRETCLAFEERHLDIAERLKRAAPGSGNLVIPRDFFRVDATYVKVMDRIVAVDEPKVPDMSARQRLVFLRSLAYSLKILHAEQIVHGDLKPDNVLVQKAGPDLYAAMLIDFDEGYVVGKPPRPEHIVGDPIYYSPELLRYIKQDERLPENALSTASDMFSFGLLLHWFLTGAGPRFDTDVVRYPAEALLMRQTLDVSAAPPALRNLIAQLLDIVPSNRPDIDAVIEFLGAATEGHVTGEDVTPVLSASKRTKSKGKDAAESEAGSTVDRATVGVLDGATDIGLPDASGGDTLALTTVPGDREGLYATVAGEGSASDAAPRVCDKTRLQDGLDADPERAGVWLRSLGSDRSVDDTLAVLTPVLLGQDTIVTEYTFRSGRATTHQAILQAGTAVLIDHNAQPRVRCASGNPLDRSTFATDLESKAVREGSGWSGFSLGRVVDVAPARPGPITDLGGVFDASASQLIAIRLDS